MLCPSCHKPVADNTDVCRWCGAEIEAADRRPAPARPAPRGGRLCPACGAPNMRDSEFCVGCGKTLPGARALRKAAAAPLQFYWSLLLWVPALGLPLAVPFVVVNRFPGLIAEKSVGASVAVQLGLYLVADLPTLIIAQLLGFLWGDKNPGKADAVRRQGWIAFAAAVCFSLVILFLARKTFVPDWEGR